MDRTIHSIQPQLVLDSYVNSKICELEKIYKDREQFLAQNRDSCMKRLFFSRRFKHYNDRRDKILKELGIILYNSSKSAVV